MFFFCHDWARTYNTIQTLNIPLCIETLSSSPTHWHPHIHIDSIRALCMHSFCIQTFCSHVAASTAACAPYPVSFHMASAAFTLYIPILTITSSLFTPALTLHAHLCAHIACTHTSALTLHSHLCAHTACRPLRRHCMHTLRPHCTHSSALTLQVDSHVEFVQDWDVDILQQVCSTHTSSLPCGVK